MIIQVQLIPEIKEFTCQLAWVNSEAFACICMSNVSGVQAATSMQSITTVNKDKV